MNPPQKRCKMLELTQATVENSCGFSISDEELHATPPGHWIMYVDNSLVSYTMLWGYPTNWLQRLVWRLLGVRFERRG